MIKPMTASQRATKSRAKRVETGRGRRVEAVITPEAAAALDVLKTKSGQTVAATISSALLIAAEVAGSRVEGSAVGTGASARP